MAESLINVQPDEDAGQAANKDQTLRGSVITAVDGATLVLRSASGKNTKTVALQSLQAPNMALRADEDDEPHAFEAREFLRLRTLGKACTFKLTGKDDERGCDVGNVWIEKENLALTVAEEGWATLSSRGEKSEFYSKLKQAADVAANAHKGMHSSDSTRTVNFDLDEVLKKCKGQTVKGVVEKCYSGSVVQVTIVASPSEHHVVNVSLSGVSSPGFKKNSSVGAFAADAKALTENALLGRDVSIKLDGVDAKQKDCASGMVWTNEVKDVRVDLLKAGLAKATGDDAKMKSLTEEAQTKKIGLWATSDTASVRGKSTSGNDKRRRRSKSPRGSTGQRGSTGRRGDKPSSGDKSPRASQSEKPPVALSPTAAGGAGAAATAAATSPKPTSSVPKPERAVPAASVPTPANLPDIYVKSFSDKNPWVRSTALSIMQPPDLTHPVVFRAVLSLLHDTSTFTLPQKPPSEDEKRLLRILRIGTLRYSKWSQVTPQEQRPDEAKEGRQVYWVRDVADKALKMMRAYPVFPDTIKIMKEEAAKDTEPPYLTRKWIDANLPNFEWPSVGKAFEELVRAMLSEDPVIEPPALDYVLRGLSDAQYAFVAKTAAARNPISYSVLMNIYKRNQRGDTSAKAILDALEKTNQAIGPEALPLLSGIGFKDSHRKRCLALMKKIEDGGHKAASGYMAIWDKAAGQRFAGLVVKNQIPEDTLRTILARARVFKFPKEFPIVEILCQSDDRDYVLQSLDKWQEVPAGAKRIVLVKMAERAAATSPRSSYEPLFELGKMGALTKDAKLSQMFFDALSDSLSATDEWHLEIPEWDPESHPLVFFSPQSRRPANFDAGVLDLMKKNLISASIVASVLKPSKFKAFEPPSSAKDAFLAAMRKEVDDIEQRHSEDSKFKKNTIRHPSECAVWDLKNRWMEMRKTVTILNDRDYGVKMDLLMRAPNPKIPYGDWF